MFCFRLCGGDSMRGSKTIDNDSSQYFISYEEKFEKEVIVFDNEQNNILMNLEDHPEVKNIIFVGASGTGKTIMAIQSMKGLIQRYNALEAKIAYIYALCFRGVRQLPSKYLLNYLKENITSEHLLNEPSGMKIQVRCEDIFYFSEEKGISMDMQNLRFFSPLDLIQEISHRLNQLHRDGPVILFVDEFELIEVKESDVAELGWDYNWNGLRPPGCEDPNAIPENTVHLIISLNPGTSKENGRATDNLQYESSMNVLSSTIKNKHYIPANIFHKVKLNLRYRNSEAIQKFTQFVAEKQELFTEEIHVPPITGDFPIWIDIGIFSEDNFKLALNTLLTMSDKFKNSRILLKEDHNKYHQPKKLQIHLRYMEQLQIIQNAEAEEFRGSAQDAVIYVGPGNLEAFSRARMWLGIITYHSGHPDHMSSEDKDIHDKQLHRQDDPTNRFYRKALIAANEQGLVQKIDITQEPGFIYGQCGAPWKVPIFTLLLPCKGGCCSPINYSVTPESFAFASLSLQDEKNEEWDNKLCILRNLETRRGIYKQPLVHCPSICFCNWKEQDQITFLKSLQDYESNSHLMEVPQGLPAPQWFCDLVLYRKREKVKLLISSPLKCMLRYGAFPPFEITYFEFVRSLWAEMSYFPLNSECFIPNTIFEDLVGNKLMNKFGSPVRWSNLQKCLEEHVYFKSSKVGVFSGEYLQDEELLQHPKSMVHDAMHSSPEIDSERWNQWVEKTQISKMKLHEKRYFYQISDKIRENEKESELLDARIALCRENGDKEGKKRGKRRKRNICVEMAELRIELARLRALGYDLESETDSDSELFGDYCDNDTEVSNTPSNADTDTNSRSDSDTQNVQSRSTMEPPCQRGFLIGKRLI